MDTILVTVVPGEIITAGATLEVHCQRPVDPRSAQASVRVRHGDRVVLATVTVAKRGRVIQVPTNDFRPGAHELVVDELLDTKGERLTERVSVPFVVGAFAGDVPRDLRVEHAVHLSVGELASTRIDPGQRAADGERYVEIIKAVHRDRGDAVDLAFDEGGNRVEAGQLLGELEQRRAKRFGKLHETLWRHLETVPDDAPVDVVVWPRIDVDLTGYDKPTDRRLTEPPAAEREHAAVAKRAMSSLSRSLTRLGVEVRARRAGGTGRANGGDSADRDGRDRGTDDVPMLELTIPAKQVRELAKADAVGAVFLNDRTAITDLGNSIAVARSDRAQNMGFDGTGVRVAVFEDGPSVTTNLVLAGRFTSSPAASDHARLTHAIVKNVEPRKPHGHAPDCDLFSANSSSNDALRWAARQGCTVISQSFHRSSEPGASGLQADDVLKDYLALRWPYPTIVQAAGNFWSTDPDDIDPPSDEYVNHKGYNTLSIGNHDDTAGAMSGDSVFRNPASPHGDRELPELAANGTSVTANGQTMSGTSFAAPATAGVTALLQDVDPVLCSWPEGCRAILLASAGRNISDQTWWVDVASRIDASDGSGAVDAQSGVSIAQQRRWRGAPATSRGWDVGTLSSADIGGDRLATFRYHVQVPRFTFSPKVKVALAWDSKIASFLGIPLASVLTVDLDLIVRDSRGVQVATAASWDNSYEVAEFSARRGESYEIIIRRWSGTDSTWFGIAWAVTGIPIFVEPIGDLELTRFPFRER
jgi:hypothetical protein